ncbi:hypothetical protein BGZ70_005067 [Mortierella alpina]|uniref:RRM domain-containing protein n=1 Tax=Mortierella alpina TaxID=64518 RepID=A0A9P6J9K6_MORAP|nr:hypothetical protein BGZ70_005067 [Mortierella alpina]
MSTRVYLGRLSRDASDRDVESLFKSYGRLREVTLKNGFGFVEFSDPRDAKDAVYDTHGKEFLGERLVVELARGDRRGDRRDDRERDDRRFRPPERTEHRLIVENLAHGVSWQDIKDMMRKAGEVTFADISRDDERQGVVEFSSAEDVENALKTLNGEDLRGNPVTLREFDPSRDTAPRDMGRGGGGGGGRDSGRGGRDHENVVVTATVASLARAAETVAIGIVAALAPAATVVVMAAETVAQAEAVAVRVPAAPPPKIAAPPPEIVALPPETAALLSL